MGNNKVRRQNDYWIREFDFDFEHRVFFTIFTDKYIIQITGGSIIILDKRTGIKIKQMKGYNYLYTGDVKSDESELFALENGKHFYIFSLTDFEQKRRVTLPRSYEALDVFGSFSNDGKFLYVPVYRFIDEQYKYWLCEYETESYSLVSMKEIDFAQVTSWYDYEED